jgi:Rrf2 family protein
MKLVTRNTDYALRALCYMSKQKDVVTVDQLVKKLGVPRPFMRKILQQLNKERILESYKGRGGGFKLKATPEKIYIIEIMRIFQGQVRLNGCFLKKDVCPNKGKCVLRKKIRSIEEGVLEQLRQITIASLVQGQSA